MDGGMKDNSSVVHTYRCSRCEGVFDGEESVVSVQCPYCAMICDGVSCKITGDEPV